MYLINLRMCTLVLALWVILLTACGGGGGGGAAAVAAGGDSPTAPVVALKSNELRITVDSGLPDTGYNVNRLYTTVTVCQPGSTQCQTIDHVLVDTGSTGLRLLSSAMSPGLTLSRLTTAGGSTLLNCAQFVDNTFAWGPVAVADIVLGGKMATSVPIQIINDPAIGNPAAACSGGGTAITTTAILGANGIVGMGLFKEDCGTRCTTLTNNGVYYSCSNVACTTTTNTKATIAQQVKNPVPLFASDNNGVLIDLPSVNLPGTPSHSGLLVFGVGTQTNNQLNTASILTANALGYITTLFTGSTLTTSILDTGTNGLYFDSASLPLCSGTQFYCPSTSKMLSASLVGGNAASMPITFAIDNATDLFGIGINHVLPTLGGNVGRATTFDWGLPFFYGRRVFFGIEGMTPSLTTGAFYAL